MRLPLEKEGLYVSNDTVTLINMELGLIKKFERDSSGFTFIPRELLSVPSVLVVKDGGIVKDYVVTAVDEKETEIEQVTKRSVMRRMAEGHIISVLAGEGAFPIEGENKIEAMAYLRAL